MAQHPTQDEVVIDGVLRKREVALPASSSKSRKTWGAIDLTLAGGTGRDWLGFPVRLGRCLHIDCELSPGVLTHRVAKIEEGMQINLSDVADRVEVLSMRGKPFDIGALERLSEQWQGKYDLLVADPLYHLYPFDDPHFTENDNARIAALFARFAALACRLNVALVIIHHTPKLGSENRRAPDAGAGAGAMGRDSDCCLVLRPDPNAPTNDEVALLDCTPRSFSPVLRRVLPWRDYLGHPDALSVAAEPWTPARLAALVDDTPIRRSSLAEKAGGLSGRRFTDFWIAPLTPA